MTRTQWMRRQRSAVGVTVGLVLLLGMIGAFVLQQTMLMVKRDKARDIAFVHAQKLVQRLQESVGPAYMAASRVQEGGGEIEDFNALSERLLMEFPMARAIELAPDGVIRQVYPLAGNEPIVGHDLLKDRDRNLEAHTALTTRQLTLAGPFDLLQGGFGVVGRYPVFLSDNSGRSKFWGFSVVLIRVPELLAAAGMMDFEREGYRYELCRILPNGGACVPFARDGEGLLEEPVTVPVNTLNARWILSVAPAAGWGAGKTAALLQAGAVALALLFGTLQYLFVQRLKRVGFSDMGSPWPAPDGRSAHDLL